MTLDDLADRLTDPRRGGIDGPLAVAIITSLAGGEQPGIDSLAGVLGTTSDDIAARLRAIPETEYTPVGDVAGHIITQLPAPNRIRFSEVQLYAWCPLDTLIVPPLLGRTAHVEGTCGVTGEAVSFLSTPDGALCPGTPDLHLSLPLPQDITHLRSAFCRGVRFLVDAAAAQEWTTSHPGCVCMPLDTAVAYAADIANRLKTPSAMAARDTLASTAVT